MLVLDDVRLWRREAPEGMEKPPDMRPLSEGFGCSRGVLPEVEEVFETVEALLAARRS
jgi:ferritin-like protein